MDDLPVTECLPEVLAAVKQQRPVILQAPPGAGKTTGVPPALLESGLPGDGRIVLLQPRRMAARATARRLAAQAGESVGQTYGYHVRFDRKVSRETKVVAMTNGILLRELATDPLLEQISCVIFDEFHERSLEIDLALGMVQRIRRELRGELSLVVMSATLETEAVAGLLQDAVTVKSEGREYPVDVRYEKTVSRDRIEQQVADVLPAALRKSPGDVLVFLPGVGEIHRTAERITDIASRESAGVFKLYGDLPPAEQDAVLRVSGERKIVLATNVAETSLTIPGVTAVVDSGLARIMEFDAAIGLPCLRLQPISKASADQRAGRAGRASAGICFRLWPQAMHRSRAEQTAPEIARADLSAAMLTLAVWGERDVREFPWVTPPSEHAIASAERLLRFLGAIDADGAVTESGRQMASLPVHPRLAKLLLSAVDLGCLRWATLAAALLSERDPLDRSANDRSQRASSIESDLIERVVRIEQFLNGKPDRQIHPGGAKQIARVASQLERLLSKSNAVDADDSPEERFSRALLSAYPDRLAKRRRPGSLSARMVGGRGVQLEKQSAIRTSELFLCISVDGKGEESRVRLASAIDRSWLPADALETKQEVFFHPSMKSVVARRRTYFHDLSLDESPAAVEPNEQSAELLYQHAAKDLTRLLPKEDKSLQSFIARWRFLSASAADLDLPPYGDEVLQEVLREFCRTRTSVKELTGAPWADYLRSRFSYEQLALLDRHAPETMEVPSGNRLRITYEDGKPPVLPVRIQEIYGWEATPRLAGGTVALQLHLLGPNHRPQQITDDLESFWKTTYHEVRKELRRRYSKHHWPEDPSTAKATRNGLKPKNP